MLPVALYLVVAAALTAGAVVLYLQRGPRRAALATLRVATSAARASTSQRESVGRDAEVPPGREGDRAHGLAVLAAPLASALARPARHLVPASYATNAQRRLTLAGRDRSVDFERFMALRLASFLAVVPSFVAIALAGLPGMYGLLLFLLSLSVLVLGPEAWLDRALGRRQGAVRRDLPAMLELLMISVEAGLAFDQALARAAGSVPGPLGEEFARFLGEVRMGADHRSALEAIDRRTDIDELRSFLMALVQAETFGVSVAAILRSQAEQARTAQRQHVQEEAQKAPVKMLFPLVFCVLPALFIVVAGPAGIEIYRTLVK